MTATFELEITPRSVMGKGASRRLRREQDVVPAIIYSDEKSPAMPINILHRHVKKAMENEAFYSHILTLKEGKNAYKVVLKDVQRHPHKPIVLHMDFQRVSDTKPIIMHIPLHFLGQDVAPGVKDGGIVTHHMVELEIRCLPKDLPEFIEVDLSNAPMNHIVHLSEIGLPTGVEVMSLVHHPDNDLPVASIHRPKVVVEEEAAVEAPPEPEAIKQKAAESAEGEDKGKVNKK